MKNLLHLYLPVLILTTLLSACAGTQSGQADSPQTGSPAPDLSITLLHINDHHSHLDEDLLPLQLETAPGVRERINLPVGGLARVASSIKNLAATRPNVIKIHAGDAITGDLFYNLTQGQADAALMNVVCFDTFTLGNHEFDNGDAGLKVFLDYLRQGNCKTKVLSANVRFGPGSVLNPAKAPGLVQPSAVIERFGRKIALVGITTADKTKNSSRPDKDTLFADEAVSAQTEIDRLTAQGIKHIVLQTHYGYQADLLLAHKLRGVDVIVGGDSHTLLGPDNMKRYGLTPQGSYPTLVTDMDGKRVCVVQAGQYAYVVGELRVDFDKQGDVLGCTGTPHVLVGDHYARADKTQKPLTPNEINAIQKDIQHSGGLLLPTAPDAAAQALLAPYKAQKTAFGAAVIATAKNDLCLRRVPGTDASRQNSTLGARCNLDAHVQAHGGDIQQLVAEAFLQQGKKYFNADLSIQNGGGVRMDLSRGPVTVKDIYTILPFKNTLVQLKATGTEIKAALEEAVDAALAAKPSAGAYPYSAGLRWTIDTRQPKGSRLSNMEIRNPDGQYRPFNLNKTWNVATISFLADGQDHYSAFKGITGARRIDVGLDYAQTLLDYIAALPGDQKILRKPPTSFYSTHKFIE